MLDASKKAPEHCAIIANFLEDSNHDNTDNSRRSNTLKIVYGGRIMPGCGLENIASAVRDLDTVEFCIYGLVIEKDEFVSIPNAKYKRYLTGSDEYYESTMTKDVMIAGYTSMFCQVVQPA